MKLGSLFPFFTKEKHLFFNLYLSLHEKGEIIEAHCALEGKRGKKQNKKTFKKDSISYVKFCLEVDQGRMEE